MGDFGSATETMRIIDLYALLVFAKNLDVHFRVFQYFRRQSESICSLLSISGFDPKATFAFDAGSCITFRLMGRFRCCATGPSASLAKLTHTPFALGDRSSVPDVGQEASYLS